MTDDYTSGAALSGKTVLVTGSGGFIGSHLTEALVRAGAKVRAFVHYNSRNDHGHLHALPEEVRGELDVIAGDICDAGCVRRAVEGSDVVLHLAALIGIPYSYHAPRSYADANFAGTLNVAEACRECGVERLVHTSTSEVYGTAQFTPMTEAHPLNAQSPYAATKLGADSLVHTYYTSFDLPAVILRPFNTFGPRQSRRAVIPTVVSQALAGDEVHLGSTTAVRDFLYVADNARGYLAAATAPDAVGRTVQIGTGRGVTVGAMVEMVGEYLGKSLRVVSAEERKRPAKSEVEALVCSPALAKELMGWEPTVTLEEGLGRVVEWLRAEGPPTTGHGYVI
jgi:dTDP-glucose 4,6-dehydratase